MLEVEKYSIGEGAKNMLEELKEDVVIYQMAVSGAEDENIADLLKGYEDGLKCIKTEVKCIKTEVKDHVLKLKFTEEYTNG